MRTRLYIGSQRGRLCEANHTDQSHHVADEALYELAHSTGLFQG
jgi:hypothetical protein